MFFKAIGIYWTCNFIHRLLNDPNIPKRIKKLSKEIRDIKNGTVEEEEKKPKEAKSESAFVHHVVRNRIGF